MYPIRRFGVEIVESLDLNGFFVHLLSLRRFSLFCMLRLEINRSIMMSKAGFETMLEVFILNTVELIE